VHLVHQFLRPFAKFGDIRVLQRKLEPRLRGPAADCDVLRRLEIQASAGNLGELRAQPVDDL
jgi:hypothetical protein